MAVVSELQVIIDGDSSKLLKSLSQSSAATKLFSSTMGTAAAGAGVAIVGIGAAATAMAMDYEESFTRISALSNASAQDIERWKGEVLDLAGETAQAPKELADALFFLSSAGLEAAEIMPALEVSAKAAAVGLGETEDIANIVASALNAYSDAGLEAADVTDTLVAAVREGRAEPDEFANALGRILPIASQAGVEFDDVTASLAALSNIGLDVNEGVTAMRGAMQAIVAPGSQAADALKKIGLTAQDMLDAIGERGLFGALQMLDQAARANTDTQAEYIGTLREVVPNVRALTGVLGLTGQEAEKVQAIFDNVKDSTGALGEAMSTVAQSPGFKLRQILTRLQTGLIALGNTILPTVVDAFGFVADAVDFANDALKPLYDAVSALTGAEIDNAEATQAAMREHNAWYDEYSRLLDLLYTNEITWDEFKRRIDDVSMAMGQGHATSVLFAEAQEEVARRTWEAKDAMDASRRSEMDRQGAVKSGMIANEDLADSMDTVRDATKGAGDEVKPLTYKIVTFARMTKKAIEDWRTDVVEDFRGTFLDISNAEDNIFDVTADEFIRDARRMARQATRAANDLAILSELPIPDKFEKWLIDLGPGHIRAYVEANKTGREEIEQQWRLIEAAAVRAGDTLDRETRPRKIIIDTQVTRGSLDTLVSDIEGYAARHYMIDVGVHTGPESPWPDEALKLHLVDPMKAMGFKRKGDGWELDAKIGLHTETKKEKDTQGPHGFIGSAVAAIADATTVKESKDWADAMRKALAGSIGFVSGHERALIRSAAEAMADVTTAKEARDWKLMMMRRAVGGLQPGDLQEWKDAREQARADNLAFAVKNLPGLKDIHRRARRDERLDIHLDRKRFAEELSYDASYRGW